jgi:predicted nucleotidyltransferase
MSERLNSLEEAILKTIVYYDIFNYPLSAVELWQWLWKYKCKLSELVFCLENNEVLKRQIETKNGFYFLKGRKDLLNTRKIRRDYSVSKWKIALRAVKSLRTIPFVQTIILCNSIAYFNAEETSDIDFFIIIKDRYLWLTRFLITITLHFLKIRRHGNKINDRICLSFYITDSPLNLEDLAYKKDVHFYYWLLHFVPIFDNGTYKYFLEENKWLKEYIPRAKNWDVVDNWKIEDNIFTKFYRNFWERVLNNSLGNFLNLILKRIQLFKMSKNKFSQAQKDNTNVVIKDTILKFHEEDNRKKIRDLFYDKVSKYDE